MTNTQHPLEACRNCRPGDVLITRAYNPNRPGDQLPMLSTGHRFTIGSFFMCFLSFEARALVISYEASSAEVFVLCDGRLGWIIHQDVDRLERSWNP